jgi:hypothetical protein
MAKIFSQCLGEIISRRRIDEQSVSGSIYLDAKEFFQFLSQAVEEGVPQNPPASANTYMIAARIIRIMRPRQTDGEVRELLKTYSRFFTRIQEARDLNDDEVGIASSLQQFLDELHRQGQS